MSPSELAKTIISQLKVGVGQARMWSWGFRKPVYGIDKGVNTGYLRFIVSGRHFKGIVKITVVCDLYTVEFIKNKRIKNVEASKMWGSNKFDTIPTVVDSYKGVYCDQLSELIDDYVEYIEAYTD